MSRDPERYFDLAIDQLAEAGIDGRKEASVLKSMQQDSGSEWWGVIVLSQIGTSKAVPALQQCLGSSNKDLKDYAFFALARILKKEGQDLYVEKLNESRFPKLYPMRAISEHCDDRAVSSVVKRLKRVLKAQRVDGEELVFGLDYLRRIGGPEAESVFELVYANRNTLQLGDIRWIQEEMPELLEQRETTGVLTTDELIQALHKAKFFDGYTASAQKKAEKQVRENYEEGLSGENRKVFQRFPACATAFVETHLESEPADFVKTIAKSSLGMFKPKRVKCVEDEEKMTLTLSFEVGEKKYQLEEHWTDYLHGAFMDLVIKAFKKQTKMELFNTYGGPDDWYSCVWTICKKKAWRALVNADLLPGELAQVEKLRETGR